MAQAYTDEEIEAVMLINSMIIRFIGSGSESQLVRQRCERDNSTWKELLLHRALLRKPGYSQYNPAGGNWQ
jgi:hypothetical protein